MPRDVHKSLELLEEYHAELFRTSDAELKYSIEKVIEIFKRNLFNALCDIHEFYENVLLNKRLSLADKIFETRRFADRWEQRRQPIGLHYYPSDVATSSLGRVPLTHPSSSTGNLAATVESGPFPFLKTTSFNRIIDEYEREWEVEEVLLDASQIGLGFSISGGRDRDPEPDHYIRVTDVSPGGAVARDGQIRVGDVILRVNDVDCVNVDHQVAVDALQRAGPYVRMLVKRLKPQRSMSQSFLNETQQQQRVVQEKRATQTLSGTRSRSLHQIPHTVPIRQSTLPQPSSVIFHHSPRQMDAVGRSPNPSGMAQPAVAQHQSPVIPQQQQAVLDPTKGPRTVTLLKTEGGLGFNIVGGEDGEPIYVSHVLPGGAADLSGNVRKGDVLLRVNDTDLHNATHQQAAFALKSIIPNSYVRLHLHYRPREYHQFEDKVIRLRNDLLQQQRIQ